MFYKLAMDLRNFSDIHLLKQTKELVLQERKYMAYVLDHLKEIEIRRLFSDLKYSSLFEYAVKELGYSEGAAARRICASRLLKEMPHLLEKFENGTLNITNVSLANKFFKDEEIKSKDKKLKILNLIENKTKSEAELILFQHRTKTPPAKEEIKRISPTEHSLTITITDETLEKLQNLKRLLAHKNLSNNDLLSLMIDTTTNTIIKKKFKVTEIKKKEATPPAEEKIKIIPLKRTPTASIKRTVYQKDNGKCTQCGTNHKLEYDHIKPYALGGKTTPKNLRLLCFSCNQRHRMKAGLRGPPHR